MSFLNPRSGAEASDGIATLTAIGMAVAALIFALNVAEASVSASVNDLFDLLRIGAVIFILAVLAPLVIFFKLRGGRPAGRGTSPGYLSALFRQAALTAFSLTVLFLVFLTVLGEPILAQLSAERSVDLILAFALASFSLAYFVINRFSRLGEEAGEA